MTQTEKRIEVVKLLHELRREGEATGDVFLRGLRALKSLQDVERRIHNDAPLFVEAAE